MVGCNIQPIHTDIADLSPLDWSVTSASLDLFGYQGEVEESRLVSLRAVTLIGRRKDARREADEGDD